MPVTNSRDRRAASPLIVMLAVALAVPACTTLDPYTDEKKVSKTTTGAAIGAAAGVALGVIVGGDRKRLLAAAGIGAIVGGSIGYYMDRQEAALRDRLRATGVSVSRYGDQIVLNMPGNVTFATNSADVTANFYPVLDSVAIVLNEYEKTYVDVVGHTDSTGSAEYNQRLSERRASSVASYLASQGVVRARLVETGMGLTSPIADNSTPEGRARNRRVEIVLTPVT